MRKMQNNLSLVFLTRKAQNTMIIDDFANTVDPDEMAHNEPSHLNLQCLPSSLWFFKIIQFIIHPIFLSNQSVSVAPGDL